LYSRVYHESNLQRYTLPYVVGHSQVIHSDWLRSALIRAVCYCSSINDFNHERIYLALTYLVNGYSLLFIETRIQHFFHYFKADTIRYCMDQTAYNKFRRQILGFVDVQHQISDKNQQFDCKGQLFRFNYLYQYGSRCRFRHEFHRLWSEYFINHPMFSVKTAKIVLTTKHLHSLNALLSRQNSDFLKKI